MGGVWSTKGTRRAIWCRRCDQREEAGVSVSEAVETGSPILNGPYDPPERYYDIGPNGRTNTVRQGRRPSESFIPIAPTRKGRQSADGSRQESLDFDITGERRERNTFVNDLRREVERWRMRDYERVTPPRRARAPSRSPAGPRPWRCCSCAFSLRVRVYRWCAVPDRGAARPHGEPGRRARNAGSSGDLSWLPALPYPRGTPGRGGRCGRIRWDARHGDGSGEQGECGGGA